MSANSAKAVSRSIYLDTQAAEASMKRLIAQSDLLKQSIDSGEKQGKSLVAEMKKFDQVQSSIKKVQDQMDNGLRPSIQQQTQLVTQLRNEMNRFTGSEADLKKLSGHYQQQNQYLQQLKQSITGVAQAQDKLNEHTSQFGKVFTHVAEAAASFFAVEKIFEGVTEVFKGSIEEAMHMEETMSRLHNTLENIGRIDLFDKLKEKAEELSKKFKIIMPDEAMESFQKFITYGKLTENQMYELTELAINFAAKQHITTEEASSSFIKAMEGNAKALKVYGISMKEGHTVTDRFGILMDVLKPKVEGAADAFGKTYAGQLKIARTEMKEMQEEIGNGLMPVLAGLTKFFVDGVKGMGTYFNYMQKGFKRAKMEAQIEGFNESEDKYQNGLIESYRKDKKGNTRSDTDVRKDLERDLESDQQQKALAQLQGNIEKENMYAKSISNTTAAIKKLNVEGNVILGNGDPNKGKDKDDKHLEELQNKYADLVTKLKEKLVSASAEPLQAAFDKINLEANGYIKTIEDLLAKGGITGIQAREAIKMVQEVVTDETLKSYQQITDKIHKDRKLGEATIVSSNTMNPNLMDEEEQKKILQHAPNITGRIGNEINADAKAGAQLGLLNSKTAKERLEALKKLLDVEESMELDNTNLTEEQKELIRKQFDDKRKAAEKGYAKKTAEDILYFAGEAIKVAGNINKLLNNNDQARIVQLQKNNDKEKALLSQKLNSHAMSQNAYNMALAKMDLDLDNKKRDLELKQFRRKQGIDFASAIVNGGNAILKTLDTFGPPVPPNFEGIIAMAFTGATIATQLASIAGAKPNFADGGRVDHLNDGKITASQNIKTQASGDNVLAYVKQGEVILNERQQAALGGYKTFSSIGVPGFASGGRVTPFWEGRAYQSFNYPLIQKSIRGYAGGGSVSEQFLSSTSNDFSSMMLPIMQSQDSLNATLQQLQQQLATPIQSYVVHKQLTDASSTRQKIIANAALNQ